MSDRILSFAERRAQAIRAEGDEQATKYYQAYAKNAKHAEFAQFLLEMEMLPTVLKNRTTFLLDGGELFDGFNMLTQPTRSNTANPTAGSTTDDRGASSGTSSTDALTTTVSSPNATVKPVTTGSFETPAPGQSPRN